MLEGPRVALHCPYCDNPMVLSGQLEGAYRPKRIIPFKTDEKEVKRRFRELMGKNRLTPNELRNLNSFKTIQGIYYPF